MDISPWQEYVRAVNDRPGDYTAQDRHLAEVVEEFIEEILELRRVAAQYADALASQSLGVASAMHELDGPYTE